MALLTEAGGIGHSPRLIHELRAQSPEPIRMHRRGLWLLFLPALLAGLGSRSAGAGAKNFALYGSDRGPVEEASAVSAAARARVVLLGERHSDEGHHELQLWFLRRLMGAGHVFSLGLEMFPPDGQADLDRWSAGESGEEEFAEAFARHWTGSYWPGYRDIFLFARDRGVPLLGLNAARRTTETRAGAGPRPDSGQIIDRPGEDCAADPSYRELLAKALNRDPADEAELRRFCETQIDVDRAIAGNIAKALGAGRARAVVTLAGVFHAWDRGVPARLQEHEGFPRGSIVTVMPRDDKYFYDYEFLARGADFFWTERGQ